MGTDKYGNLLLPSGGYRSLKSFQLAQLIYDITVRFVELYIPAESRTCDQMVQAARSGVQNIAEGSVDAATSTKLELNLYNAARASEKSFFFAVFPEFSVFHFSAASPFSDAGRLQIRGGGGTSLALIR